MTNDAKDGVAVVGGIGVGTIAAAGSVTACAAETVTGAAVLTSGLKVLGLGISMWLGVGFAVGMVAVGGLGGLVVWRKIRRRPASH